MVPRKIIIDTDPASLPETTVKHELTSHQGVDDILAMLLACSAIPSELEILLISATYGNIDVQSCLRNVVSLFYHIEKEIAWRKSVGRDPGFETLRKSKPLVAVGPDHPLADEKLMADFFHGKDGLGGIHESASLNHPIYHPHMTPADTWKGLFNSVEDSNNPEKGMIEEELKKTDAESIFTPSRSPGHTEILRLLRENEPDTISIIAIGPLTNLALAAAEDPETFLRVQEVVVMGGNIDGPGNMTPVAEFNIFADSMAAARLLALTSPHPHTTMPPIPPAPPGQPEGQHPPPHLSPYPKKLSRQLNLTLFPLDITERHSLTRGEFRSTINPHLDARSPMAEWMAAFMSATFEKVESLHPSISGDEVALALHDPLCVWYCMAASDPKWAVQKNEDIRVEVAGQWTRGMCVVDRRDRKKRADGDEGEVAGDTGDWLRGGAGNRVGRCVGSPGEKTFGGWLLGRVMGDS
ncbi:uncharacterized protein LTR77_006604 [Saxophila tyrrhenica]|uniref:Inosine/uridine-preferring nucleoside hydrolase domain-containing protein n=1 Tax=Saxophila tyrrhenica TaxID=1690608 RepID=A0AAV9P5V6_9PEZI|nr:hypothetical protein LTR77_006604 [Saxophila tyrrhenica]